MAVCEVKDMDQIQRDKIAAKLKKKKPLQNVAWAVKKKPQCECMRT